MVIGRAQIWTQALWLPSVLLAIKLFCLSLEITFSQKKIPMPALKVEPYIVKFISGIN